MAPGSPRPGVGVLAARRSLRPDCANCFGLCCVAPALAVSADFAIDKPAGRPCPNLRRDFGCSIHATLRADGFPGCAAYDCFGAGQRIAQETFGGTDWRASPTVARQMFAAFRVARQLHELLWYLAQAQQMDHTEPLHERLAQALSDTEAMASGTARDLESLDVDAHRSTVNALLLEASERVRSAAGGLGPDRRSAPLIGMDLRRQDLRNASLRGAVLVGANLSGLDLGAADFTGADLRGAHLQGANLSACLFLTQAQIDNARGDARTVLPADRTRPGHWG